MAGQGGQKHVGRTTSDRRTAPGCRLLVSGVGHSIIFFFKNTLPISTPIVKEPYWYLQIYRMDIVRGKYKHRAPPVLSGGSQPLCICFISFLVSCCCNHPRSPREEPRGNRPVLCSDRSNHIFATRSQSTALNLYPMFVSKTCPAPA